MGNTFYFDWEVSLMVFLQAHMGSISTAIASFFTLFGEEMILILVMGFCYWCYDKRLGIRIGINLCLVSCWGSMIKNVVLRRRPYFDNEGISCLKAVDSSADIYDIAAQGYSFPSGHSSCAAATYGTIGLYFKKNWATIIAVAIPLLVGISRFCLGVHYPTDVLCGWLLGLAVILLIPWLGSKITSKPLFYLLLIILVLPGCFFATTNDYFTSLGMTIGMLAGNLFEEKFVDFENSTKPLSVALRIIGGVAIYFALNAILKLPFSSDFLASGTAAAYAVRSARYAIILFMVVGVYPMVFKKK